MVAVATFAVMGILQARRRVKLASLANELGLRFSEEDPFDVNRRYGEFALFGSGHSLVAENFAYGQLDLWPFRAFDFNYEAGHGTSRITRRFGVLLLELPQSLAPLLLWQNSQACSFSVAPDGQVPPWSYIGQAHLAKAAMAAFESVQDHCPCFEVQGNRLMLAVPQRGRDCSHLTEMASLLAAVREYLKVCGLNVIMRQSPPAARIDGNSGMAKASESKTIAM